MPSDARKKRDAKKKDAAKSRQQQRNVKQAEHELPDDDEVVAAVTNGISGVDIKAADAINGKDSVAGDEAKDTDAKAQLKLSRQLEQVEEVNAQSRSCTGVLVSHERSRDIKIDSATLTFFGHELLLDSKIEFNCGNRYGLIGLNGSGKSSLFNALKNKEFPLPANLDIFLLAREQPASDKTALEAVIDVDEERLLLEAQADELAQYGDDDECHERLMDIYERLDEMGADMAETRAAQILHGLGFTKEMQAKPCKDFSGGWRMRIALSRALYLRPSLLLLDEPTNHLDLDACVWLEEELKTYKRILVVISHSQDFMNTVCTNIIHLTQQKLNYYGGNYDTFVQTRIEQMENQMKRYNWEQSQIAHMKDYIARFGHGSAKLARQAQSKEKTLSKMVQGGLTEKAVTENVKSFHFLDPGYVPPPVIMVQHVSFRYKPGAPLIYKDLDFGLDLDTRVALVGPNGAGKSTLLNLISAELMPSDGLIRRHSHVKIGRYHQHLHEQLDLNLSALEYMQKEYPDVVEKEAMRKIVGRYGLTGRQQTCPMKQLSDGQRCRVSFAWLAYQSPHILLLDEPTNHLDIESIDALAEAINDFEGGLILVSHDFRLIKQVADIIWICEHEKVTVFEGDIFDYKEKLRSRIERRRRKAASLIPTKKK